MSSKELEKKNSILDKDYDDWTDEEIEVMKKDEDCCSSCGFPIKDEDWIKSSESRGEFWGAPCSETIVTGYCCSKCGHTEEL
jgi:hypothetical protein